MKCEVWRRRTIIGIIAGAGLALSAVPSFAGTPTLGASCGTGASIVGSDTAGKVTLGSGSGLCVLTFSTAYDRAPACTAVNETNGGAHAVPAGVKTTTATLLFDGAAPWADGDILAYVCQSY